VQNENAINTGRIFGITMELTRPHIYANHVKILVITVKDIIAHQVLVGCFIVNFDRKGEIIISQGSFSIYISCDGQSYSK
jgi:hypothetical protein